MIRTDEEIRFDVLSELKRDPSIDPEFLDVWASEGVVGLAGSVDTDYQRWRAERVARAVEGVREVLTYIEVARKPSFGVSDEDVVKDCVRVLARGLDRIRVRAEHGVVTLEGTVARPWRAERAEDVVRRVSGVRDVVNLLVVEGGHARAPGAARVAAAQGASAPRSDAP